MDSMHPYCDDLSASGDWDMEVELLTLALVRCLVSPMVTISQAKIAVAAASIRDFDGDRDMMPRQLCGVADSVPLM